MHIHKLSDKVNFTYIAGVLVSAILVVLSIVFYSDSGYPLMFSIVAFFTYLGVIIRGIVDPDSWGRSPEKKRFSALTGLISVFVIFAADSFLILAFDFSISQNKLINWMIVEVVILTALFFVIYFSWFRHLKYE